MANPFLDLQARLAALIAARPYFADLVAGETLLTEQVADLDNVIANSLLALGYGVVVKTASGDAAPAGRRDRQLDSQERFTIDIVRSPTLDTDEEGAARHSVLDALWEAMQAIHGQPADGSRDARGQETFQVTGHANRDEDAAEGLSVHQLFVSVQARLL